jgi:hypothetical protein
MQTQDRPSTSENTSPIIEVGTYPKQFYQDAQATFVVPKTPPPVRRRFGRSLLSPLGVLFCSSLLMVALVSFGLGASATGGNNSNAQASGASTSSASSSMTSSSSQATPSNVPDATQKYGGQPATYVLDKDGAKHFTFTARQVMWEVVKGQRVLAWTGPFPVRPFVSP